MQTVLYARRVLKACDIVHGSLPGWCSSRGVKSVSPKLRTRPPSCVSPSLSSPQARFGVVLSSQANFYRVRVDGPDSAQSANEQVQHFTTVSTGFEPVKATKNTGILACRLNCFARNGPCCARKVVMY